MAGRTILPERPRPLRTLPAHGGFSGLSAIFEGLLASSEQNAEISEEVSDEPAQPGRARRPTA